ncbi:hypothetical protein ACETAC_10155 [Aceticella autotrophica]|uniref:Uncharacterized protein n=1 Tax=Aceticella autotrophica TaxID=2755338 RepID=A0A975GA76_9THEO|nr:hypothetical protein [Aceticella autotrophica]QSZ27189.1 hypothetical protein ACETAC_10155 [Aceticella autotrophica]
MFLNRLYKFNHYESDDEYNIFEEEIKNILPSLRKWDMFEKQKEIVEYIKDTIDDVLEN